MVVVDEEGRRARRVRVVRAKWDIVGDVSAAGGAVFWACLVLVFVGDG